MRREGIAIFNVGAAVFLVILIVYNLFSTDHAEQLEQFIVTTFDPSSDLLSKPSVTAWSKLRQRQSRAVWQKALKIPVDQTKSMKRSQILSLFPITFDCDRNYMYRIGSDKDGGKWICGEYFARRSDCVVVSIGSNGDFSFEEAVLKHPSGKKCTIHTFDCTGSWEVPDKRINLHPWCLSKEDTVINGRTYKSWDSILKELQINNVDLLKMDIEGYEWNTLPYMLQHPEQSKLPKQIFLEIHFFAPAHAQRFFQGKTQPEGTPADLIAEDGLNYLHPAVRLFQLFDSRGYQVAATEYNYMSSAECCQEFTFVRAD